MQLSYSRLFASWVAFASLASAGGARADEVGTAVYIRSDTDDTTVIAPRLRGQLEVAETTKATLVYAVDVWTSASIDIMASASKRPVTEQRDELDISIDHELAHLHRRLPLLGRARLRLARRLGRRRLRLRGQQRDDRHRRLRQRGHGRSRR